jgi:hypothetical protein
MFMSFSCKDWAQSPTTGMPAVIACCYGEGTIMCSAREHGIFHHELGVCF